MIELITFPLVSSLGHNLNLSCTFDLKKKTSKLMALMYFVFNVN